jgi:D-alanyl-lipoteichoic acid acyltransferase DltB (MBOAT superfamily)
MYYFPEPPFFLLFVGFFIGVTCGLAFQSILKKKVNEWYQQRNQPRTQSELTGISAIQLPFFGICVGICVFLASGLEIFLYNRVFSYGLSLIVTLLIAGLVWSQLQNLILQLLEGGSKALDLDSF